MKVYIIACFRCIHNLEIFFYADKAQRVKTVLAFNNHL